jgi:hypothetical protein
VTNFVRIANETGVIDAWGEIPLSQIALQARPNMTVLECSQDTVQREVVDNRTVIILDLAWLKNALRALVDSKVQSARSNIITDIAGQSQIYEKKEAEARLWIDGDDVANPSKYPFMIAESVALNVPVSDVKDSIIDRVNSITPIMAELEAKRVAAKIAISNSQSIQDAIAASLIDLDFISASAVGI